MKIVDNDKRVRLLLENANRLRSALDGGFSSDTALPGTEWSVPSGGQCAAVSLIVNKIFSGELVSTAINGESHWFNRITVGDTLFDVDITGDQYGFPAIQIKRAGVLYPNTRVRHWDEVTEETKKRARLLASRAKLKVAF